MPLPANAVRGRGFYGVPARGGYAVTFDPGAHRPQQVTVMLSEAQFRTILDDPKRFDEVVVPEMTRQNVKVR